MDIRGIQSHENESWHSFFRQLHPVQSASPPLSDLYTRYVFTHEENWIGHGATRIIDINVCHQWMPFGLIGGLHMDPSYSQIRYPQVMKATLNLIEKAQKDLRAAGCIGALVWSDQEVALKKLGFLAIPNQWWIHIPRAQIEYLKRVPPPFFIQHGLVSTCSSFATQQMMVLYEQVAEGAKRSPQQWKAVLSRPHTHFCIVLHKDQMVGYFLMSAVGNRKHVVHEFYVPSQEVLFYGINALEPYLSDDIYIMGSEQRMRPLLMWSRGAFDRRSFFKGTMGLLSLFKPHLLLEYWLELNATTLKKHQLRTHQSIPITLEFYHHSNLIHRLELHKDFQFMFEPTIHFLARRQYPAPDLTPIRFFVHFGDSI